MNEKMSVPVDDCHNNTSQELFLLDQSNFEAVTVVLSNPQQYMAKLSCLEPTMIM